jgi:hypothetical protein
LGASSIIGLGANYDEDFEIDIVSFKKKFLNLVLKYNIKELDQMTLFNLVHLSLAQTLEYDIKKLKYILVHLHMYTDASKRIFNFIEKYYTDAYFLPLVRDIRESWIGWKEVLYIRNNQKNNKLDIFITANIWKNNFIILYDKIQNTNNKRIKIIDLNKLHFLEDKAIIEICSFLNIEYNDILLVSTFGGKSWIGNASNKQKLTGLNIKKSEYQWQKKMNKYHARFLNTFLYDVNFIYGYSKGDLNSLFMQRIYYIYYLMFFLSENLCSLLPQNTLNTNDIQIIQSIKNKKDITNKMYSFFPFYLAKALVFLTIFRNRYLKKIKNSLDKTKLAFRSMFSKQMPLNKKIDSSFFL